jgi:hypothetical protein
MDHLFPIRPSRPLCTSWRLNSIVLSTDSVCVQIIYLFAHTLYLHPLAKYPGPFLAKFTTFYAGYHAWKGDVHVDMWRCYEKYGMYNSVASSMNRTDSGD